MAVTNANYGISVVVNLDTSRIQEQLNRAAKGMSFNVSGNLNGINNGLQETTRSANAAADAGENLGLTYQQANLIFSKSLEIIEAMVEQVYELDSAMTELKKVSDLSGESLKNYVSELAEAGKEVGRTASEMTQAASEFKRSGFSDDDAQTLSTVASLFQNVADEEMSASDAAGNLVSQMMAFNISAEDAISIVDRYNAIANTQAVSTGDLSSAMEVAGSALATYANDFNESISLITAGTTIMQGRSSQVARGNY